MYNPTNGVLLNGQIRQEFHRIWGYQKPITPDHFINFLNDLIQDQCFREQIFQLTIPRSQTIPKFETKISSQTPTKFDAGSETRVYDPKRIMELRERMIELRKILSSQLTPSEKILADSVTSPSSFGCTVTVF
jgi:hypothetical protein